MNQIVEARLIKVTPKAISSVLTRLPQCICCSSRYGSGMLWSQNPFPGPRIQDTSLNWFVFGRCGTTNVQSFDDLSPTLKIMMLVSVADIGWFITLHLGNILVPINSCQGRHHIFFRALMCDVGARLALSSLEPWSASSSYRPRASWVDPRGSPAEHKSDVAVESLAEIVTP